MRKLDLDIIKNGFIYKQIIRNDYKSLYEQRTKCGEIAGHELFLIKSQKQRQAFGKTYPAKEKYPSNQDFGSTAWSVGIDRQIAIQKFNKLEKVLKTFK